MDNALVQNHHQITSRQLADAIAVGQIIPGPILSSATFAGFLVNGWPGGLWATLGIVLPSFFISFFLYHLHASARKNTWLRAFPGGLNAASIAVIASVGFHLFSAALENWREIIVLLGCFNPPAINLLP